MKIDLQFILGVISFAYGACIASFLNVVIWRVPRGESLVRPPSHCPKCNAPIRWWQNIPIFSWLALRGRCASCRAPISPRYLFVEVLGGVLFTAMFWRYGCGPDVAAGCFRTLVAWTWVSLMIVGSFIDYDLKLLPDFVTVGGMILGVAAALVESLFFDPIPFLSRFSSCYALFTFRFPLFTSLSGLAVGFGLLWLIRFFGSKAFRREAMGLGDVFLMGAVGALLGPQAVLATMILASVSGSLAGLAMVLAAKTRFGRFMEIPFGPFICLGCLVWMLWGDALFRWYLRLVLGHPC